MSKKVNYKGIDLVRPGGAAHPLFTQTKSDENIRHFLLFFKNQYWVHLGPNAKPAPLLGEPVF